MKGSFVLMLALCAPLLASAEIYKCPSNGTTSYTDQPCLNGDQVEIQDNRIGGSLASPDMVRISTQLARDRLVSKINRAIEDRTERVNELNRSMHQDIANIQRRKSWATDDIEGALWQQSLSLEQNATAKKYDVRIQAEQRHLDRLIEARRLLN